MTRHAQPRLVADSACVCGEGVLWDPERERVWWVEMVPPVLFALEPPTGVLRRWSIPGVGQAAAVLRGLGGLLLVVGDGLARIDPRDGAADVAPEPLLALPLAEAPRCAFNDAKAHPSGAVFLASADTREGAALGGLERLGADGGRDRLAGPFVIGNGPCFSPDGRTMYASDTLGRRVLSCPLDRDGRRDGTERLFAAIDAGDGMPDGMTTDSEGALWVAFWAGGQVVRYDRSGRVLARVPMPVRNVTSVAFGGPDLRTLYVTTGSAGLSDAERQAQPGAGGLFALEVAVPGRLEPVAAY